MRVFQGLTVGGDEEILINATRNVASELYRIPSLRSLCEIQIDEEDYQWLRQWARRLTGRRVQGWLDGVSSKRIALNISGRNLTYAEAFGCMFLLLASESARREASEGRVWSVVYHQFPESIRRILFQQGQPRESLKDAMEASARKMNLRHVYGQEGTQEYYIGVYLQFGFTRKGIARLPHWLAGQGMPESVQYLTDGSIRSKSFVELWDALKNFRKNNITESSARGTLDKNPWILLDWTDELIIRARERLDLGTSESGQAVESEQTPPEFISTPRLRWDNASKPVFVSHVENLADLELTADRYLIQSGSARLAMLFRSDDGSYRVNPEEIILSADSPELMAVILDDSGHSPVSQLITLWDPTEEVQLFDLSTGFVSRGGQLSAGKGYALLVSDGLDIVPADLPFHHIGGNSHSKRLYRIEGSPNSQVSVNLGGESVWQPESTPRPSGVVEQPNWAEDINVHLIPSNRIELANATPVSLSISGLDDETQVTYVRAGARPLDFEKTSAYEYASAQFDVLAYLSPKTASPEFTVRIGLRRDGQQTNVARSFVLSVEGVLRMTDTGWQVVNPSESLSASDAKQYACRLLHTRLGSKNDLALMEGSVFLSRPWIVPRPIHSIGGYGAPLGIRSPYNQIYDNDLLAVADEVHDRGVVETALAGQDGTFRIYLSQPLEPGELHSLVFWTSGKPSTILPAQELVTYPEGEFDVWDVRCPDSVMSNEGLIAISYDGARIGAWWSAAPYLGTVEQGDAQETAAMLRWMRAPILSQAWLEEVRAFAHRYPAYTLKSWLEEEGLSGGLVHGAEGEVWRAAVRQIFSGWTPDARSAKSVLGEFGQRGGDITAFLSAALLKLLRLDPLLMGTVARALIKAPEIIDTIRLTRCLVAELPPNATHYDFDQREKELLDEVASQMGIHDRFIDGVVRKVLIRLDYSDLNKVDRNNAEVALNVAPFREYLGLRVLSRLLN